MGFFRRKSKGEKILLSDDTPLDRKGKVDGSRLLDDNGDPTEGTLFQAEKERRAQRRPSQEAEEQQQPFPGAFPQGYGQTYPPQQQGFGYPQQQQQQYGNSNSFGPLGRAGFPSQNANPYGQQGYPMQYDQGQQFPKQYGNFSQGYAPQTEKKKKTWFGRSKK